MLILFEESISIQVSKIQVSGILIDEIYTKMVDIWVNVVRVFK